MKRKEVEGQGSTSGREEKRRRGKKNNKKADMCGIWTLKMVLLLIDYYYDIVMRKVEAGQTSNISFTVSDWKDIAKKINRSQHAPPKPIQYLQVKQKVSDLKFLKCRYLADVEKLHGDQWKKFCAAFPLTRRHFVRAKLAASLETSMSESGGYSLAKPSLQGKHKTLETPEYPFVQVPPELSPIQMLQAAQILLDDMFQNDQINKDLYQRAVMMLWKRDDSRWNAQLTVMAPGARKEFIKETVEDFEKNGRVDC